MSALALLSTGTAGALLAGCAANEFSAADRGRNLVDDATLSTSSWNDFACTTCHDREAGASGAGVRKPGAPLAGATLRPTYWGGAENDLLASINACLRYFMLSTEPLTADDERAEALYAYLESLEPGDPEPAPFTVVRDIENLPRGDAARGAGLYGVACQLCHGELHTGNSRLTPEAPILPEDTVNEHVGYSPRQLRLVFIEKTRHGPFLSYGGSMPPLSLETLSDPELSDILEYLTILGE
jgi:thiosulfate dehydrogenase